MGRRSNRQVVIDLVKANPGKTSKELHDILKDEKHDSDGRGIHKVKRKDVPKPKQIMGICVRTPGIVNNGTRTEALWDWVGEAKA